MNQHNSSGDEINAVEELNRSWDTWNARSSHRDATSDELKYLLVELDTIDDVPSPDASFLANLRADLVKPIPIGRASALRESSLGLVANPIAPAPFPRVTPIRLVYAGVAAILLIVALVGGDRWLPGTGSAVMVASAMASPATRDQPTATSETGLSTKDDGTTSLSLDQSITQLVTYPTAIPLSPEDTTIGAVNLRAVRTPAIVYSIE